MNGGPTRGLALTDFLQDIRYGWRSLRNSPTAKAVVVLTLAIGVGANTAIFSVIKAALLKPLPYRDASRLVVIGERWPALTGIRPVSRLNYRDWVEQSTTFEQIAVDSWDEVTVTGGA